MIKERFYAKRMGKIPCTKKWVCIAMWRWMLKNQIPCRKLYSE